MDKKEIRSYMIKSMFLDGPGRHLEVARRYVKYLENETLQASDDVKENLEPDIVEVAKDIFDA